MKLSIYIGTLSLVSSCYAATRFASIAFGQNLVGADRAIEVAAEQGGWMATALVVMLLGMAAFFVALTWFFARHYTSREDAIHAEDREDARLLREVVTQNTTALTEFASAAKESAEASRASTEASKQMIAKFDSWSAHQPCKMSLEQLKDHVQMLERA